jgi:hypothetical protein
MKHRLLAVSNGWAVAPHLWLRYLLRPVQIDRTPTFTAVRILGVAWFFETEKRDG